MCKNWHILLNPFPLNRKKIQDSWVRKLELNVNLLQRWTEDISVFNNKSNKKWVNANGAFSLVGLLDCKQKQGLKPIQQFWEEKGFSSPISPYRKYTSLEAFGGLIFGVHPHKVGSVPFQFCQ